MTADTHEAAVARLREAYAALPPGARSGWPSAPRTCSGSATAEPGGAGLTSPPSGRCCTSTRPAAPAGSAA